MISLNSVIKFLSENNKNKKINDYDSIPKFELKKAVTNFQECVPCLWTKCARLRSHLMVEVVGECDPLPGQWSHRCRQGISETCP